jgi:hypothetical protein
MNDHPDKHIRDAVDYEMTTYTFTAVLAKGTELTDELVEALYEAGCDDSLPGASEGIASVIFAREAESLEHAIRSALADVQKTGCRVSRVEMEPEDLPVVTVAED